MLQTVFINLTQLFEELKNNGITSSFNKIIFLNKNLVTFEIKLSSYKSKPDTIKKFIYEIQNITKNNFKNLGIEFSAKSRYFKTVKRLEQGYEAFVMIINRKVIGDVWFAPGSSEAGQVLHPDIKMLEIKTTGSDVYMFDMYVDPEMRGTPVAATILNNASLGLKSEGFDKIYTYVMTENIPALWMIRALGFRDIGKTAMRRFLFSRKLIKHS